MKRRNYTDEQIISAVKSNESLAGVLRELGLKDLGGNYGTIKRHIERLGLNTDHFTGQLWNKGKTVDMDKISIKTAASLEDIFNNKAKIRSNSLKNRLISAGLKERRCECCGGKEWNGKPIPLELHHIDGNHNNNNLSNLQILCPNCHAQTDFYRGKGISRTNYKVPDKTTLLNKLKECGSVKNLAKDYDVSESTVREWVKKNNMKEDWIKAVKEFRKH